MRGRLSALGRLGLAVGVAAGLLVGTSTEAVAVQSKRAERCDQRADLYAAKAHSSLTPEERQRRIAWLYEQCAENDAADEVAEEQGWMAPALFPNRVGDNHGHPLHCLDLSAARFGMHTNDETPNPPPNPTAPGGTAQLNIPGEFMYAWIDGKPRFFIREVVWTIDDIDGEVISPIRLNFQPAGLGTTHTTTAEVPFTHAYVPTSLWVELPASLTEANTMDDLVLPGRRMAARTWYKPSACHDKRAPMIVPEILIDHMKGLGWTRPNPQPRSPRLIRFVPDGDPNDPASWSLTEIPTTVPDTIYAFKTYRWFYDAGGDSADKAEPNPAVDHDASDDFAGPAVTITGTATDNAGVTSVELKIKDRDTGKWLRPNGTFGSTAFYHEASLGAPGTPSTTWSLTVDLPPGRYNPVVRAFDGAGNEGKMEEFRPFNVVDGSDTQSPEPKVDHPRNKRFDGPSVTITGTATDNVGVKKVRVKFKSKSTGKWLQPDGTWGNKAVYFTTKLDTPGAKSTTWSITKSFPNGDYNPVVKAVDEAGNSGKLPASRPFRVR